METSRQPSWLVGLLAAVFAFSMLLDGGEGSSYHQGGNLSPSDRDPKRNSRYEEDKYREESKLRSEGQQGENRLEDELKSDQEEEGRNAKHVRRKRLLWITTDGRLALPPGTHLTITPSLSLPFVRYPPEGFLSNMSISLPFSIDFDLLGLTDNQNPYGVLPPLLGRSLGREAGNYFADYVANFMQSKRFARSAPPTPKHPIFHGGERALLYTVVEDLLSSFGMDGKACLLRAICEVHSHESMQKFGLVGEIIKLFFSATKSPFAHLMGEYVDAEKTGREKAECWPYFKKCPKSLFLSSHNKYTKQNKNAEYKNEEGDNEIEVEAEEEEREDSVVVVDSPRMNVAM